MKENDDHKENIDEIIYELSETREDERNSQNQILQTFATAAAILALILGASIFEGDTIIQKPYAIRLSIYLLSVMILTATISYIISLGITNVLRFHYIKQLENKLSSIEKNNLDLPHWISFNTAINTRNIKHIFRSPYTVVSFCFYFLAIVFLILFCFGLVIVQHDFLKLNRNSLIIIPFSFIFISLFAFVWITTKSKNMYHFSCMFSNKRQQESVTGNEIGDFELTNGKNIFLKGLSYFIYPKTKDFQKALFVLIGYVLGVVLTYNYSDFLSVFYENLGQAFLVFL